MLLKGNERRIVVVEKLNDPYFEKAVFYIRCGVTGEKSGISLADRAQEILESLERAGGASSEKPRARRPSGPASPDKKDGSGASGSGRAKTAGTARPGKAKATGTAGSGGAKTAAAAGSDNNKSANATGSIAASANMRAKRSPDSTPPDKKDGSGASGSGRAKTAGTAGADRTGTAGESKLTGTGCEAIVRPKAAGSVTAGNAADGTDVRKAACKKTSLSLFSSFFAAFFPKKFLPSGENLIETHVS